MADDDAQAAAALAAAIVAALPPLNPGPSLASALAPSPSNSIHPIIPPGVNYSSLSLENLVCYLTSMAPRHPKLLMLHGWLLIAQSALSSTRRRPPA